MQSLLKIQKIRSRENIKGLRNLYNHVESCVRNVKALKLDVKGYGSLLIPILKEKLPDDLMIVISRKFGSNIWSLDLSLTYFNEELRAQENCMSTSCKKSDEFDKSNIFSASSLYSQTEKPKCIFCDKSNHTSTKCRTVTNPNTRMGILKKKNRCFLCLGYGHNVRNCRVNYTCRKCNGKHNISICDKDGRKQDSEEKADKPPAKPSAKPSANCLAGTESRENTEHENVQCCSCNHQTSVGLHSACAHSHGQILMQTAKADVLGHENAKHCRILFDSASQRSYITIDLQRRLNLKAIRKESIFINPFGNKPTKVQHLDVVRIKVKHRDSQTFTTVEVLCTPEICAPITNQPLEKVSNFREFAHLELADYSKSHTLAVEVLIGIDYYYSFITGKIVRSKSGVVATESSLGWVLSGKVGNCRANGSTHNLRAIVEPAGDIDLNNSLNKFWQIEETGTSDSCVINQFTKDISHDGNRYVTKLPFKSVHESLPDNFFTCEKR